MSNSVIILQDGSVCYGNERLIFFYQIYSHSATISPLYYQHISSLFTFSPPLPSIFLPSLPP